MEWEGRCRLANWISQALSHRPSATEFFSRYVSLALWTDSWLLRFSLVKFIGGHSSAAFRGSSSNYWATEYNTTSSIAIWIHRQRLATEPLEVSPSRQHKTSANIHETFLFYSGNSSKGWANRNHSTSKILLRWCVPIRSTVADNT